MKKRLHLSILFLFVSILVYAQPGKDGPRVITALNTVVNCYSAVGNDVVAGQMEVTVNNAGGIDCDWECGDLVLLYQAQGASINTTNTTNYGNITNYNSCGLYEFNYVTGVAGNTVYVQSAWANNYTADGRVQLVKVPQYTTLTVNAGASIVPGPWQDVGSFRYGGIVAIHVMGTLTVNGSIHANGYGFRPGALDNNSSGTGATLTNLFVSTAAADGGAKGESIAGFTDIYDVSGGRYGRGAPANGGGGGNGHNAGGGGGSNGNNGSAYNGNGVMCTGCAGAAAWSLDPFVISSGGVLSTSSGGGRGGYTFGSSNQNALTLGTSQVAWGGDYRDPHGGFGGKPLTSIAATSRIFFGGGGGAGDRNNNANQVGGTGGGIVYLMANSIVGAGNISSNGTDALNQIASSTGAANDAPSGGGGGGTVILRSPAITGIVINARGGKGGDQGFLSTESEGPGGGGGGGFVAISAGSPAINVNGGDNGITLSGSLTEFTPNGATSGGSGSTGSIGLFTLTFDPFGPITTTSNSPVCVGSPILLSTTPVSGVTYSWTGPPSFTSSLQNPTIASASLANNGTFQVVYSTSGGCTDTGYVNVVVTPLPVLAPTTSMPLCFGDCTGTISAVTSSGTAPYSYNWTTGALTQNVSGLCAGSYTVTVTDANLCTTSATIAITQPIALAATTTNVNPLCNGSCNGTITVNAAGGTGTLQYSLNGGAFQTSNLFTGLCAGAYSIVIRDANNCTLLISTTLVNPPLLSLSLVTSAPATCGVNNGSLTVAASGGTGTYTYSIGGPFQVSPTFTSLSPTSYTVTVQDANGCTATLVVPITAAPSPIASIISQTNLNCFGGMNGAVLIGATGGTPAIQYQIDPPGPTPPTPFQLSNSFTGLAAGTYGVTIMDANGCIGTTTFTITAPPQLTYTTSFTNATCNEVCNGTITVTPAGGTPPYEFSSDNGLSFSSSNPLSGLCDGNVFVVVRDANGCLANSVVVISQPAPLAATYTPTNPICPDVCNGQVVVNTVTGGTGPYQYSSNGGPLQVSNTLTGLCDGPNTILVQDANGCQLTALQSLVDPPHFIISVIDTNESHCGFNDGSFEVMASGGFAPYSYNNITIGLTQPTGLFTDLIAGGYDVEVTDANGCIEQIYVGVNDIEMDGYLDALTNATCFGSCDGTVSTHGENGTPPLQYELDLSGAFQLNGDFTGLCAGSHVVVIIDNGFCIYTVPFEITEPDEILLSTTVTNVACNGGATGSITATGVTGGNGVYQYSLDGGLTFQGSPTFTGLSANTYTITVQDGNGCLGTASGTINESTPVTFVTNLTDLTCFGNNTGFIQIVASGGNAPYTYSINGGTSFGSTFTFPGLAAGSYDLVVHDVFGCEAIGTVVVNEPAPLAAGYILTPTTCNGSCDGLISVNASGGTMPYQYSSDNGITFQVSSSLSGLCAGAYNVVVRDSNNCIVGSTQTIIEPSIVVFVPIASNTTCNQNNGVIDFTAVSGGTPTYNFSIDGGVNFVTGTSFTGLNDGLYSLVVEDANGCPYTASITINDESSPVITSVLTTDITCNALCNGSVTGIASGGTGTLVYDIGGTGQATGNFASLCAGSYLLTVTDANGCIDTNTFEITEPPVLTMMSTPLNLTCFNNFTGQISIIANGGTPGYLYSFDNGASFSSSSVQTNLAAGTYNLVVEDVNGCSVNFVQIVTQPTEVVITSQSQIEPSCYGFCDGEVTVNVTGGTVAGSYTYNWAGGIAGLTQNTASGLCSGTYDVIVEDDNGCPVSTSFTLTDPLPYVIDAVTTVDALCFNDCNGTLTVVSPAGVQFSIDGGATFQASPVFTGLCDGVYTIQSTNANGCIANTIGIVSEPTPVTLVSTPDSVYCAGSNLPLFAFAFGGTPGYTYTWSNGFVGQTQDVNPVGIVTFTVVATDANGCISNTDSTTYTPFNPYTATIASDFIITCPGEPVTLTTTLVDGYPYYEYLWNTGDTTSSIVITNDAPNTYEVIVNDQCQVYDTLSIFIDTYVLPNLNFSVNNASGCVPMQVSLQNTTPAGEIGTDCIWTFSNGVTLTGCDSASALFAVPGCYDVSLTMTSLDGCVSTFSQNDVFCVHPNPLADFTYNPVNPTILNNEVNFFSTSLLAETYSWNFADLGTSSNQNPSFTFQVVDTGAYEVCLHVVSEFGCVDDTCKLIVIGEDFAVYVPNAFTPDGDGVNDLFFPVLSGTLPQDFRFMVFNRWGELIFDADVPRGGWDGTHKNMQCKEDVYVWKLRVKDNASINHDYVGHVTLLR